MLLCELVNKKKVGTLKSIICHTVRQLEMLPRENVHQNLQEKSSCLIKTCADFHTHYKELHTAALPFLKTSHNESMLEGWRAAHMHLILRHKNKKSSSRYLLVHFQGQTNSEDGSSLLQKMFLVEKKALLIQKCAAVC